MKKASLEGELAAGRSISREIGRDPSTVSYWAHKHASRPLTSRGTRRAPSTTRAASASRSMPPLSSYAIAQRLSPSQSTVRHWLKRYGLRTAARHQRHEIASADAAGRSIAKCFRHGVTRFAARAGGGRRCLACRSAAVAAHRRKVKRVLVQEAGG